MGNESMEQILGTMSDEEVEERLKEARRIRGI